MIYDFEGNALESAYSLNTNLSECYTIDGILIPISSGGEDYDEYYNEYQHSILNARDEWKVQYRADNTVIPYVIHTDQHGILTNDNIWTRQLFNYLGVALKWSEISACIGLGDVDISDYSKMFTVLSPVPDSKKINIWGNHDLWRNYTEENNQYIVDFDTNYFDNGDYVSSYAYSHKGIEYHIDQVHNIKYVCLAGWEIDKAKGGKSYYLISQQSMDDIIDILEMEDGYDIVLLSHCQAFNDLSIAYYLCPPNGSAGTDTFYENPVQASNVTEVFVNAGTTTLDEMLWKRNTKSSGTILDSYGNSHSYDFTNCTGNILCNLVGHGHRDAYGYATNSGILVIEYDAFAYNTNPFYMVNIDRTNGTVDGWKITSDAVVQSYSIPLRES